MTSLGTYTSSRRLQTPQAGFTLVEIMVGLVIGMIATLIIMQVFTVFENQKRTTSGGADAQTNGSIGLYNVSRALQQAGWAIMPTEQFETAFKCTTVNVNGAGDTYNRLTPVSIVDGVSDTITVRYGTSGAGGAASLITRVTGNTVSVENNFGCSTTSDNVLVSPPIPGGGACSIAAVSAVSATSPTTDIILKNVDAATVLVNSNLACVGSWNEVTFKVIDGTLNLQNSPTAAFVPSVAGIVNIQAQYGISLNPQSNQVIQWVDATGSWANPSINDRNSIKAVRIAIVARNETRDMAVVTNSCSSTTGAAPTGLCAWDATSANPFTASPAPSIDLSADPDWRHYRYRVFETIVPIRNIVWSRSAL